MRLILLSAVCAALLAAQDSDSVLLTSVMYRTQQASNTSLTDEQRAEVNRLGQLGQQLGTAGKYGEAMRSFHHGMAVMQGVPWSTSLEFASSIQAKVDHALAQPGKTVTVSLTSMYATEKPVADTFTATVVLRNARGPASAETVVADAKALDPAKLPVSITVPVPADAQGYDLLEVRLVPSEGTVDPKAKTRFTKSIPVRIESLSAQIAALRERLTGAKAQDSPAVLAASYTASLYDWADAGTVNPQRYDFRKEIANAIALIDAVDGGVDPFASKKGDFRRAYRSDVDQQLQPYRIFVPDSYDGTKAAPLVVALHGMGGNEDSMFDGYEQNLKREAAKHGFLVACPKGRTMASMYRGSAEKDVMDVLADVRRDYKVDGNRIYLMGHSMGGYGTWTVAMNHPDVFAALGPFAGGGNPAGMAKIKDIPEYVVHGDDDKTVSVAASRMMVEAGKKVGAPIEYVEVPGGSHSGIVAPNIAAMLDFFAKQHKSEAVGAN
ncbi:MAG: prolyl oligopeptidase family serine peptidase [Bryobacteraceae bacterium]